MDSSVILYAAFQEVFKRPFVFSNFDDRLRIQKMAYLIQSQGIRLGDYGFRWYKRGPYSQAVQDDAIFVSANTEIVKAESSTIEFTQRANEVFEKINSFIKEKPKAYSDDIWLEAIASLHFLKKHKGYDNQKAIGILESEKPHLADRAANEQALRQIEKIC